MKNSKKLLAVFIMGLLLVMTLAGAALPVLAAAFSISLSSYSGVPNSTLYVYGSGLTANGTNTYTGFFWNKPGCEHNGDTEWWCG